MEINCCFFHILKNWFCVLFFFRWVSQKVGFHTHTHIHKWPTQSINKLITKFDNVLINKWLHSYQFGWVTTMKITCWRTALLLLATVPYFVIPHRTPTAQMLAAGVLILYSDILHPSLSYETHGMSVSQPYRFYWVRVKEEMGQSYTQPKYCEKGNICQFKMFLIGFKIKPVPHSFSLSAFSFYGNCGLPVSHSRHESNPVFRKRQAL